MHLRTAWSITFTIVVMAASGASADKARPKRAKAKITTRAEPPPGKGFWKVLVQPNAKWKLYLFGETQPRPDSDFHPEPITIETYDVRKVGDADVARVRWRQGADSTESALAGTHAPPLDQFAVTPAGLYILTEDMDDARIAEALKGKPSRSDPPKPYKATKRNEGRYLEIRDGLVCMGEGPAPEEPPCEDICGGEVCISATDGIVRLEGNWAPDMFDYIQVKAPAKQK
jgi:hypothetical protein